MLPFRAFQGTWRDLAVWKEKDALRVPPDCVPLEYAALLRELFTAYRLLEDHGNLKVRSRGTYRFYLGLLPTPAASRRCVRCIPHIEAGLKVAVQGSG